MIWRWLMSLLSFRHIYHWRQNEIIIRRNPCSGFPSGKQPKYDRSEGRYCDGGYCAHCLRGFVVIPMSQLILNLRWCRHDKWLSLTQVARRVQLTRCNQGLNRYQSMMCQLSEQWPQSDMNSSARPRLHSLGDGGREAFLEGRAPPFPHDSS